MARPKRPGIDFFPVDVIFEDNLKIVIAIHKNEGLGIMIRLWQNIYGMQGYYAEWDEDNVFLFADNVGIPVETLNAIIETCFRKDIFHKKMWEKHKILTSAGIQKQWLQIVTDAKRKDCAIDPEYDISMFIPVETQITPEETRVSSGGNATKESKVKKSKVKKSRTNTVGAGAPEEKTAEQVEQGKIWAKLVDTWFVFYESKFAEKPSFAGRDPSNLKALVALLQKKVLAAPGFPWTEQSCGTYFQKFLNLAFLDDWLKTHFLLQNLVSQFDKIIAYGKNGTQPNGKPATGANIDTLSAFNKIDLYFGNAGTPGN